MSGQQFEGGRELLSNTNTPKKRLKSKGKLTGLIGILLRKV